MTPLQRARSTIQKSRFEVRFCIVCQALMLGATVPFYSAQGLVVAWHTAMPQAVAVVLLAAILFNLWWKPGPPGELVVTQTVFATFLFLTISCIASPAQYLAVALGRPLIDPWLATADALLGIHVPTLADWTRARPVVAEVLRLAYFSLLPQFVGVILLLGLVYRDANRLWEYCFHFHLCALVTVAALALFPAACAFAYYGFESTLPQARFLAHFNGFRDGTLWVIRFDDLEGLISMPSFHVAGGLMVTWVLRGYRILWLFVLLNGLMTISTVLTGAHYGVDIPGTALLVAVSVLIHRAVTRPSVDRVPTSRPRPLPGTSLAAD